MSKVWRKRLLALCLLGLSINGALAGAFIFIEQQPAFTSESKTADATVIYIEEQGLVQKYSCADYRLEQVKEASLPVAAVFRSLAGLALQTITNNQESAEALRPPSQAHPAHTRIVMRATGGAQCRWQGPADAVPAELQKIVREASILAEKTAPPASAVKVFARAEILSAEKLDEYRVMHALKPVNNLSELDSVLREALAHPFQLRPVPADSSPFSSVAVKGAANRFGLLVNAVGYEIISFFSAPPSRP